MAQPTEKQRQRATTRAAVAVLCLAAFSILFIGLVTLLNGIARESSDAGHIAAIEGQDALQDPFYVLLVGSDSNQGTALYSGQRRDAPQNADVITLMRVDPAAHVITLASIPRDTVVEPDGGKIGSSLSEDPRQLVDETAKLTGMRPDYYMTTSFIAFENLVNALGGIDVDVPVTVTVQDPADGKKVTVKAGKNQHLNGSQALALARARDEYDKNQDALRQANVRAIEQALIQRVLDMDGEIRIEHVLAAIEHDTYTDIDLPLMGATVLDFVQHADEVTFYDCTGPYKGGKRASDGAWVIQNDEESWPNLIEAIDSGQDPSTSGFASSPPSFD